VVAPFMPDAEKLAAVREALPAVGAGIYLNTPVAGPLPAETAAAMAEIAGWEVATGRAQRDRPDDARARIDEARGAVAAVLTADIDEIVIAHGIDDAYAAAVRTVKLRDGDVVAAWDAEASARLRGVLPAGVRIAVMEQGVDLPDGVRLVACPLVSTFTGERLPVAEIARAAHERGARLVADASLAAGAVPVDRESLGADVLVVRSEAFLLGPEGLAIVAAPRDVVAASLASHPGRGSGAADTLETSGVGFHLPSVVGLGRSCGWLSMYVGLEWIHRRGVELAAAAADRLRSMPGVQLLTPPDAMATVLSFRITGWTPDAALDEIGGRVFAIAGSVPSIGAIRIGLGFFNTAAEVDRFLDAVALLAAHTPETLPPRLRLSVLGSGS
jgi:selenocysteine lyase/cysteine desulfurase